MSPVQAFQFSSISTTRVIFIFQFFLTGLTEAQLITVYSNVTWRGIFADYQIQIINFILLIKLNYDLG